MDRNYHDVFLRPVEPGDISYVAENMRKADREELEAAYGTTRTPRFVLELSVKSTPDASTILSPSGSGEPVALIGTRPPALLGEGKAVPWMLGTDKIFQFPRAFVQGGRGYVKDMLEKYGALENFVDVRNVVSARWLKNIGFTLEPPAPYGAYNMPFQRFHAALS